MKLTVQTHLLFALLMLTAAAKAQFANFTTSQGLPDNNTLCLAVASGNVIWAGTQNGVASYNGTTWKTYETYAGLPDTYIKCIAVDKDNAIWVGTDFGISKFSGTTWTNFTANDGLVNDQVNVIACKSDGTLYIGTNGGLSVYKNQVFTNYRASTGLPDDNISALAIDNSGNLWAGTALAGACKFDGTTFTKFNTTTGLPSNNISCIACDAAGNKYIGSLLGVTVLSSTDAVTKTINQSSGLCYNMIKDVAVDSYSRIWSGIYDDYLLDGCLNATDANKTFKLTKTEGLINNKVQKLAIDAAGNIWIATLGGISKYDPGHLGVNPMEENEAKIYPNPASGWLRVETKQDKQTLQIVDLRGERVMAYSLAKGINSLDISQITPGFYTYTISNGANIAFGKLIIK